MRMSREIAILGGNEFNSSRYVPIYRNGVTNTSLVGTWTLRDYHASPGGKEASTDKVVNGMRCLWLKATDSSYSCRMNTTIPIYLRSYEYDHLFVRFGQPQTGDANHCPVLYFATAEDGSNKYGVNCRSADGDSEYGRWYYWKNITDHLENDKKYYLRLVLQAVSTSVAINALVLRKKQTEPDTPPAGALLLFWHGEQAGYTWSYGVTAESIVLSASGRYHREHGHTIDAYTAPARSSTLTADLTGYNKVHFYVESAQSKGEPEISAGSVTSNASVGEVVLDISEIQDKSSIELKLQTRSYNPYNDWDGSDDCDLRVNTGMRVTKVWATTT